MRVEITSISVKTPVIKYLHMLTYNLNDCHLFRMKE